MLIDFVNRASIFLVSPSPQTLVQEPQLNAGEQNPRVIDCNALLCFDGSFWSFPDRDFKELEFVLSVGLLAFRATSSFISDSSLVKPGLGFQVFHICRSRVTELQTMNAEGRSLIIFSPSGLYAVSLLRKTAPFSCHRCVSVDAVCLSVGTREQELSADSS